MGPGQHVAVAIALLVASTGPSGARPLPWRRAPASRGPDAARAGPPAESERVPERIHSGWSAPKSGSSRSQRVLQAAEPLTWRFPSDPAVPSKTAAAELDAGPRRPKLAPGVGVRCGENRVDVEVSPHLLGWGRRVKPEELRLGGCPATEAEDSSRVLIFQSELHGCNSMLRTTPESFIYAFHLVYHPKAPHNLNIIRSTSSVMGIECHYPR